MLSECFSPELRPYLTYAQHGVPQFLEGRLTHPESFPENLYCVATGRDDLAIGFAEFRLSTKNVGFLSYICVSEHARGLGIASSLIEDFALSHASLERLELDVFPDNLPATRLYEKLGFTLCSQNVWLRRHLPLPSTALSLFDPQVSAMTQDSWGFCELHVEWQDQKIRLGRIGANVLRCFDLQSFNDDDLLAGAKATFASLTEAFTVLPTNETIAAAPGTETVTLGNRMVKTFEGQTSDILAEDIDGQLTLPRSS